MKSGDEHTNFRRSSPGNFFLRGRVSIDVTGPWKQDPGNKRWVYRLIRSQNPRDRELEHAIHFEQFRPTRLFVHLLCPQSVDLGSRLHDKTADDFIHRLAEAMHVSVGHFFHARRLPNLSTDYVHHHVPQSDDPPTM